MGAGRPSSSSSSGRRACRSSHHHSSSSSSGLHHCGGGGGSRRQVCCPAAALSRPTRAATAGPGSTAAVCSRAAAVCSRSADAATVPAGCPATSTPRFWDVEVQDEATGSAAAATAAAAGQRGGLCPTSWGTSCGPTKGRGISGSSQERDCWAGARCQGHVTACAESRNGGAENRAAAQGYQLGPHQGVNGCAREHAAEKARSVPSRRASCRGKGKGVREATQGAAACGGPRASVHPPTPRHAAPTAAHQPTQQPAGRPDSSQRQASATGSQD
mmetsp:Transcript_29620/g.68625  ORF Transcript_29620/g.68625 Transcript_29620/m.68625 type:complete len:273 (+) Transcript_29620:796-1614(+)